MRRAGNGRGTGTARRGRALAVVFLIVGLALPASLLGAAPAGAAEGPDCGAGRITAQVCRLYEAYFLRSPDVAGLEHWRRAVATGTRLEAVSDGFARSEEFGQRYGALDDSAFVALVYRNVLGRDPDPQGLAHWRGVLARGASRGSVMIGFSESAEFVGRTGTPAPTTPTVAAVARLYLAYFGRDPDLSGLVGWVGRLGGGSSLIDVSQVFATSPEFAQRYGQLDDARFVELVYRNVLGRPPDADGLAYWTARLQRGMARGAVMLGFSESVEFVLATEARLPDPIAGESRRLTDGALSVLDALVVSCSTSGGSVLVYWAIAVQAPTRPTADGMLVHNDYGWAALVGASVAPVAAGVWRSPATVVRAGADQVQVPAGHAAVSWDPGAGCNHTLG